MVLIGVLSPILLCPKLGPTSTPTSTSTIQHAPTTHRPSTIHPPSTHHAFGYVVSKSEPASGLCRSRTRPPRGGQAPPRCWGRRAGQRKGGALAARHCVEPGDGGCARAHARHRVRQKKPKNKLRRWNHHFWTLRTIDLSSVCVPAHTRRMTGAGDRPSCSCLSGADWCLQSDDTTDSRLHVQALRRSRALCRGAHGGGVAPHHQPAAGAFQPGYPGSRAGVHGLLHAIQQAHWRAQGLARLLPVCSCPWALFLAVFSA